MCRYGGIANTTIQLGTIQNAGQEKPWKIEDVTKYYEFLFESDGIHVRKLPGFGKGETIQVDPNSVDTSEMPKFHCDIINKDNMDENLKNKKSTFYPFTGESKTKIDVCGNTVIKPKADEVNEEDSTQKDGIYYCKNELCRKPFFTIQCQIGS